MAPARPEQAATMHMDKTKKRKGFKLILSVFKSDDVIVALLLTFAQAFSFPQLHQCVL